MSFGWTNAITDVCLLVKDVAVSTEFYVDRLGFCLNRRAEGFVEFYGAGVTLACWEGANLRAHTGVATAPIRTNSLCLAVRLGTPDEVDRVYFELLANGVTFDRPPADYPWNARCAYFTGPDDETWEVYSWKKGGAIGDMINFHLPSGHPPGES
ncbi:VOC family protein [Agrobacterium pusense]|uniref:VOC family protein n=1 Tax=Agrobacterium pusense TaxID=648995 RepID=A0AA44IWS5_9HYPH|nr:VOC family protein [Agrobacterium pusense]MDH0873175.1 VOC family protein [Agrobacterium pusense]NRF07229.1 VOC family protein [Agrobacterium pusense]NRF17783.1 VOC family protein [Agrobacterium pusense]PZU77894.1 MAG: lactoylglutathione lyase [Rhizobium sp.]